jgi:two-component system LytT family response regulator
VSSTPPIRAIVVDDEPLTRERVRALIAGHDGLELVGEGRNGLEALNLITSLEPELIFMDVEMPELDGFGVLSELDAEHTPAVIFITAYEHYALKAFDVGAVDYLHKPITPSRFADAVDRAREKLSRDTRDQSRALIASAVEAVRARGVRKRFIVRKANEHYFVSVAEIDWIDVADNYLRLHVNGRSHFSRGTMKQAEEELDASQFVRVHRSAMVAVDRIRTIRSHDSGGHIIELTDGAQLKCSRQYARRVNELKV